MKRYCRSDSNEPVAVYLVAFRVYRSPAVDVRVKYNTKIGSGFYYGTADRFHRRFVFRVRDMVWKTPVRLKELATRSISPKRRKHVFCIKTARPVSGIHHNVEAFKRVFVVFCADAFFNYFTQARAVFFHVIDFLRASGFCSRPVPVLRMLEYRLDVRTVEPAGSRKKFEAVAVERVVACRYLDRTVARHILRHHKHGGR